MLHFAKRFVALLKSAVLSSLLLNGDFVYVASGGELMLTALAVKEIPETGIEVLASLSAGQCLAGGTFCPLDPVVNLRSFLLALVPSDYVYLGALITELQSPLTRLRIRNSRKPLYLVRNRQTNEIHISSQSEAQAIGSDANLIRPIALNWQAVDSPKKVRTDLSKKQRRAILVGSHGRSGQILVVENGGETFQEIPFPKEIELAIVHWVDHKTIYAADRDGGLIYSPDGAKTWKELPKLDKAISSLTPGLFLDVSCVFFTNPKCGFLMIRHFDRGGKVLKTNDGGLSWREVFSSIQGELKSISFLDKDTGFAGGDGILIRTDDGGETWRSFDVASNSIRKIFTFGEDTIYAVQKNGTAYVSRDKGFTWSEQRLFECARCDSVLWYSFPTRDVGYLGTESEQVLRTDNGGQSWSQLPGFPITYTVLGDFWDENEGLIVDNRGNVFLVRAGADPSMIYEWAPNSALQVIPK